MIEVASGTEIGLDYLDALTGFIRAWFLGYPV